MIKYNTFINIHIYYKQIPYIKNMRALIG